MKTRTIIDACSRRICGDRRIRNASAILAQTHSQSKRPAFYISEFEVNDPEGIKPYSQQVEATFHAIHRPLSRARRTERLPGRRSAETHCHDRFRQHDTGTGLV